MRIEENEQYYIEYDDSEVIVYKYDKINKIECNYDFQDIQFKECTDIVCYSPDIILSNCNNVVIGSNNNGEIKFC